MKTLSRLFLSLFFLFAGLTESRASSLCDANVNNLVSNCGFETGDFTGWTLSGNDVPMELNNLYGVEGIDPLDGIAPNSGSYQAYFGDLAANSTTLYQTLTTTPGDTYTVSWFLVQDTPVAGDYSNAFSASFGGVSLADLTGVPVENYTQYSYQVAAATSSSVLSLTLGNDLGEFLLDDVSVLDNPASSTPSAPEPSAWQLLLAGAFMASFPMWNRRFRLFLAGTGLRSKP